MATRSLIGAGGIVGAATDCLTGAESAGNSALLGPVGSSPSHDGRRKDSANIKFMVLGFRGRI